MPCCGSPPAPTVLQISPYSQCVGPPLLPMGMSSWSCDSLRLSPILIAQWPCRCWPPHCFQCVMCGIEKGEGGAQWAYNCSSPRAAPQNHQCWSCALILLICAGKILGPILAWLACGVMIGGNVKITSGVMIASGKWRHDRKRAVASCWERRDWKRRDRRWCDCGGTIGGGATSREEVSLEQAP